MQIPPVSGPSHSQYPQDPEVERFHDLWNRWFQDPTRKTGDKLLEFIQNHHRYFARIAKQREHLLPHPSIPFEESFESATRTLKAWLKHGCDRQGTTAPSEFITNMAQWIS